MSTVYLWNPDTPEGGSDEKENFICSICEECIETGKRIKATRHGVTTIHNYCDSCLEDNDLQVIINSSEIHSKNLI